MDCPVQVALEWGMSTEPRTRPGRATRARIVRAAAELVAERGVAGTSLDDVRERAHASKSQLYLYFDDRDALMRAVAQATCDLVMDTQADELAEFDSLAGIERYLDWQVAVQVERQARGGCPIGSLAGQLAERDEGARLALADGFDRWEHALRDGLETMAARGELRKDADPRCWRSRHSPSCKAAWSSHKCAATRTKCAQPATPRALIRAATTPKATNRAISR